MSTYKVFLDGQLVCKTDWPPLAQAAWSRVSRDRESAQRDGQAVLEVDGRVLADGYPTTGSGLPWPQGAGEEINARNVAGAIMQFARVAGVSQEELSDELTAAGLSTNPARLKSMSTMQQGRRTFVCEAELVVLCYAAIGVLKNKQPKP